MHKKLEKRLSKLEQLHREHTDRFEDAIKGLTETLASKEDIRRIESTLTELEESMRQQGRGDN